MPTESDAVGRFRRGRAALILAAVTASLPQEVQAAFDRFVTTEFTTIDVKGQPITWPVTPYYKPGDTCIDVTTGLGYPKKANDARANPKVALLFSDPTGSGLEKPAMVLVQGIASVDDEDLDANRKRYAKELIEKLPHTAKLQPPDFFKRFLQWYYTRIYVHVRPERIYTWPDCDVSREPQLLDSHIEEVRSGHDEEPDDPGHAEPEERPPVWDERMEELGRRHRTAVFTIVAPDGFPFSFRAPVDVDRSNKLVRIATDAVGIPVTPGLACVTAHEHNDEFTWQANFQVRGDLIEADGGWAVRPAKLLGGMEIPDGSAFQRMKPNFRKSFQYQRTARRELARRR
jgi:Pyridoxamine 5'-phosphate oxidase